MTLIKTLPQSPLSLAQISFDWGLVEREAIHPVGGRLSYFVHNWMRVTSDSWVLKTIQGYELQFATLPPTNLNSPSPHFNQEMTRILSKEVLELEAKRAISKVQEDSTGFVSPLFLVTKSDGTWRPVINLKSLNRYVITHHFKMETIRTVKGLIKPGDWLLKLDLKDAYLTVPIHQNHRKYLRFRWQGQTWQFQVLPFGLNSAPCTFTKLTKPVVSVLRRLGVRVIIYLDDMLLMAKSAQEASAHLRAAIEILVALGFVINLKKSVFQPSQRLEFLGFVIDSRKMMISLPHQRLQSLRSLAKRTLGQEKVTICQLASWG